MAVGRIALRIEGDWWVAYFAREHTMDGAIELGRIAFGVVRTDPARREAFVNLFKDALDEFFEAKLGVRASSWDEGPAPEIERGGNA